MGYKIICGAMAIFAGVIIIWACGSGLADKGVDFKGFWSQFSMIVGSLVGLGSIICGLEQIKES